jgi:hypothetical protein
MVVPDVKMIAEVVRKVRRLDDADADAADDEAADDDDDDDGSLAHNDCVDK